jgi:hypothetical protein
MTAATSSTSPVTKVLDPARDAPSIRDRPTPNRDPFQRTPIAKAKAAATTTANQFTGPIDISLSHCPVARRGARLFRNGSETPQTGIWARIPWHYNFP